jgi:hypothetical protein
VYGNHQKKKEKNTEKKKVNLKRGEHSRKRTRWKRGEGEQEEETTKGIEEEEEDKDANPGYSFVYALKGCQTCSLVYDRDSMGAENILAAFMGEHGVEQQRPSYLCREEDESDDRPPPLYLQAKALWRRKK